MNNFEFWICFYLCLNAFFIIFIFMRIRDINSFLENGSQSEVEKLKKFLKTEKELHEMAKNDNRRLLDRLNEVSKFMSSDANRLRLEKNTLESELGLAKEKLRIQESTLSTFDRVCNDAENMRKELEQLKAKLKSHE